MIRNFGKVCKSKGEIEKSFDPSGETDCSGVGECGGGSESAAGSQRQHQQRTAGPMDQLLQDGLPLLLLHPEDDGHTEDCPGAQPRARGASAHGEGKSGYGGVLLGSSREEREKTGERARFEGEAYSQAETSSLSEHQATCRLVCYETGYLIFTIHRRIQIQDI